MARLVSVNVGLPRDVEWRGRTVHTGIWKNPVQGRRRVGRLNVEGDGQGDLRGHGGEQRAVFVYQIESYRYWEERLRRRDFVHGQFGENFTIEGLPDEEVSGMAMISLLEPKLTAIVVTRSMLCGTVESSQDSVYRAGMGFSEPILSAWLLLRYPNLSAP